MPEVKVVKEKKEKKEKKVAKEATPKVAAIPIDKEAVYTSTGKYAPQAVHNIASYGDVCKKLPATYDELRKAIPEHTDFVGYLIRRGGIAPKK